jgi:hypothetical protein
MYLVDVNGALISTGLWNEFIGTQREISRYAARWEEASYQLEAL